jgi:hypothetical protein
VDTCIPLSFAPGEAYQFDWSTDKVIIGDEVVEVKVAHFTLKYKTPMEILKQHQKTQKTAENLIYGYIV